MLYTALILVAVFVALVGKYLYKPSEKCPECGEIRVDDRPICQCGWVFEYPDDDQPIEYGDPDETP